MSRSPTLHGERREDADTSLDLPAEMQTEKQQNHDPEQQNRRKSSIPIELIESTSQADTFHPIHWPLWKKWPIISIYCLLQFFIQMTSTSYVSVEYLVNERFGGSTQVDTMVQSFFIIGTAVGPAFLGPLSDLAGRKWVFVVSILLYAILNIGTALAYNLPMLIIFSFLIGTAGSTALTNVAGVISDLFGDSDGAGQPMALFVCSSNIGASMGGPVGEWIGDNSSMGWRWIYYINIIVGGAYALVMCFLPETLPQIVIARAVKRERENKNVENEQDLPVATTTPKVDVIRKLRFVATMALRIMVTEPIVMFLALYNGFGYGLIFLYLDGVYDVFAINNGLSPVGANLTYLNIGVGCVVLFFFTPIQTFLYSRDKAKRSGKGRPEARFLTSLVMVWLIPTSLLWFAFTSNGTVSYWSPVVAGGVLGFSDTLLWMSMLNYITDSYPNVAASAIAAFLIPSFLIAASMCHAGVAMFENMSTTWAFATLGFISFGLVALVYVLFFFGPVLRRHSKLAST